MVTVKELHEKLSKSIDNGHADAYVVVTHDDDYLVPVSLQIGTDEDYRFKILYINTEEMP
jgi:hypothetical protein